MIERIKERVKKGGHFVNDKDVVRRYYRSTVNFWNIYRYYAEDWVIINNNECEYKNIVIGNRDIFSVIDNNGFQKFKEVLSYAKKTAKGVCLTTYKDFTEVLSKAYKASRKVLAENKRLGIPTPFSLQDRIYYLMPDGRIILKK